MIAKNGPKRYTRCCRRHGQFPVPSVAAVVESPKWKNVKRLARLELGDYTVRRFAIISTAVGVLLGMVLAADAADSPKAAETRKKLDQPVTVDYKDTLLREVLDDLKGQIKGPLGFRVDTSGGVSMNIKITAKADAKPLKEVFEMMFKNNGLGYIIISKDGDAYDGTIMIRRGTERGSPAGQEGTAEKTPAKDKAQAKEKPVDKPITKEKAPAKEKPEEDADKAEQIAASRLKLAKQLAADGKVDRAKQRYEDIVREHPKTKAADEAHELLKKLNK